jgi:hypothetical protein
VIHAECHKTLVILKEILRVLDPKMTTPCDELKKLVRAPNYVTIINDLKN